MKDFIFVKNEFLLPLPDKIAICEADETALISNEKGARAQIYAPEINFYLKCSKDDYLAKAQNTLLLYEARASVYDLGLDLDYEKSVGSRVFIASKADKSRLARLLSEVGFKAVAEKSALGVYGCVGELAVIVENSGEELEIECDFFLYDEDEPSFSRQSGCYDMREFPSDEALCDFLCSKSPNFHYKNLVQYDSSICQYDKRRSEHCGKCVEACPSVAILKDDARRELVFSQVDCVGCGECVSVCPSGSLDFTPLPKNSFSALLELYKGRKIAIFDEGIALESLNITLPAGVVPLMLNSRALNELKFLSLLQSSGANLLLFSQNLSRGNAESIALLNEIFARKWGKVAIFTPNSEKELAQSLEKMEFIEDLAYESPKNPMLKREEFSKRLLQVLGNSDLGVIKSGEWLRYGQVSVDESRCTLCLSCVGACNVGALVADERENALKFNASLCTTCGYCVNSCAEKDTIFLERSGIELRASYFAFKTLAKDELFECAECGKAFATKKAIEKVARLMSPHFADNEKKLKSLYCCAECKAKMMIFG